MAGFVPTRGFAAQGIACSRLRASPAFAGLVLSSRSSERPTVAGAAGIEPATPGFVPTRGFAAQGIACSRLRASPAFAGLVLSSRSSERPTVAGAAGIEPATPGFVPTRGFAAPGVACSRPPALPAFAGPGLPTRGFAAQGIACSRLRASPAFAGLVLSSRSSERPVLCQLSYAPTRQPYGTDMECLYNAIMADIEAFLTDHGIPFQRFDHPAVFTCEQAERIAPPMPGTHTKNLFLRDRKGARHLLVVVGYEKNVDLKALTALIGVDKLSFASPERLKTYLGVEPGAVSLLGLVN